MFQTGQIGAKPRGMNAGNQGQFLNQAMAGRNAPQGMPAGGMPPQAMPQRGMPQARPSLQNAFSQFQSGTYQPRANNFAFQQQPQMPAGFGQQMQAAQQQMQGAMPQRQMQNPYGGGIGAAIGDLQAMFGGGGGNIGNTIAGIMGGGMSNQQRFGLAPSPERMASAAAGAQQFGSVSPAQMQQAMANPWMQQQMAAAPSRQQMALAQQTQQTGYSPEQIRAIQAQMQPTQTGNPMAARMAEMRR